MRHLNAERPSGCPINLCAANHRQLRQLVNFLEHIDPLVYATDDHLGGSIGGHIRHIIEHYDRLLDDGPGGRVDYSARQRDQSLEVDLHKALGRIKSLLERLQPERLTAPLTRILILNTEPSPGVTDTAQIISTIGRELMFLASHTVHHMAVIALLARARGAEVKPEFGIADSTLLYRAEQAAHAG